MAGALGRTAGMGCERRSGAGRVMRTSHTKPTQTNGTRQARVLAFLATPDVVDAGAPQVYETHIAHVFVGPRRALKIKRAVKLDFLDFSTLELRRAACLRELEINRPNAPDLYLSAVPIIERADGSLSIGGPGTAIEWAVEMRAFAQADLLSQRARSGPLDRTLMQATADVISAMHARAEVRSGVDAIAKMQAICEEITTICRASAELSSCDKVTAFADASRQAMAVAGPVMQRRARQGFVRRCHGDLHLSNLVVWEGRPTPFDALEFSEEMATVDTLYDLAFLLMDLEHHSQRVAANTVFNRYLWRRGTIDDLEGLLALPLFLACRAGIRALVAVQRAQVAGDDDAVSKASAATAQRYIDDAIAYLTPQAPRIIAIGGLSGSGKTTLAAALAPLTGRAPGAVHLRSDLERKAMMGVEETARLPAHSYTAESAHAVYERVFTRAEACLAAGHSIVVDAVFSTEAERRRIADIARRAGANFDALWLDASPEVLKSRVARRTGDASDATPDVVERQLRQSLGRLDWPIIKTTGSPGTIATKAAALLQLNPHAD